ncbi:MAG: plasmid pRiA4b ORF-3 family protein [Proteobacteria bacterium]|nr:plasmid pRiA4b ORF-3 family protein [Pseudomonadota bacterium]
MPHEAGQELPTYTIVTAKITLRRTKPPVWRRVTMVDTVTLGDLHAIIQCVLGWQDSHLHAFDVKGKVYSAAGTVDDAEDEEQLDLKTLRKRRVKRLTYIYDFGDRWQHQIDIECVEDEIPAHAEPRCIDGKGNPRPEDGGRTPPLSAKFDMNEINRRLSRMFNRS